MWPFARLGLGYGMEVMSLWKEATKSRNRSAQDEARLNGPPSKPLKSKLSVNSGKHKFVPNFPSRRGLWSAKTEQETPYTPASQRDRRYLS